MDKRIFTIAMSALLATGAGSTVVLAQQYGGDAGERSGQSGAEARTGGASAAEDASGLEEGRRAGSSVGSLLEQYATIDKNSDGLISRPEAIEAGLATEGWDQADQDGDGELTEAEFARFTEEQGLDGPDRPQPKGVRQPERAGDPLGGAGRSGDQETPGEGGGSMER